MQYMMNNPMMDIKPILSNGNSNFTCSTNNVKLVTPPQVDSPEQKDMSMIYDTRVLTDESHTPLQLKKGSQDRDADAHTLSGDTPGVTPDQLAKHYASPTYEYANDFYEGPVFVQEGKLGHSKHVSLDHSRDQQENSTQEGHSVSMANQTNQSGTFAIRLRESNAQDPIHAVSQNTEQLQYYITGQPANVQQLNHILNDKKNMTGFESRPPLHKGSAGAWITPAQRKMIQKHQKLLHGNQANMTQREIEYANKRKKIDKKKHSGGFQTQCASGDPNSQTNATSLPEFMKYETQSHSLSREGNRIKDYMNQNQRANINRFQQVGTAPSGAQRHKTTQRLKPKWINKFNSTTAHQQFSFMIGQSQQPSPTNQPARDDQRTRTSQANRGGVKIQSFLRMRSQKTLQNGYGAGIMPGVTQIFTNNQLTPEEAYANQTQDVDREDANHILLHKITVGQKQQNQNVSDLVDKRRYDTAVRARLQSQVQIGGKSIPSEFSRTHAKRNSMQSCNRQTFFFSDGNDASFLRKKFNQDQLQNRRKDMQAFIEAQVSGQSAKSTLFNESKIFSDDRSTIKQKRLSQQLCAELQPLPLAAEAAKTAYQNFYDMPYDQLNELQLSNVIEHSKIDLSSTVKRKGLSMYYQETLANMFTVEGERKIYKQEGLDKKAMGLMKGDSVVDVIEDNQAMSEMKEELESIPKKEHATLSRPPSSEQEQYFKREFKNPQHFGQSKYVHENRIYREIYQQAKKNELKFRRQSRQQEQSAPPTQTTHPMKGVHSQSFDPRDMEGDGELLIPDDQAADLISGTKDQKDKDSANQLMSPQQYLAKEFGYLGDPPTDRFDTSATPSLTLQSHMKDSTQKDTGETNAQLKSLLDEERGMIVNKVSTSMIDLEDIIYNKQILGRMEPGKMKNIYNKLRQQANRKQRESQGESQYQDKQTTLARSTQSCLRSKRSSEQTPLLQNSITAQSQNKKFTNLYKPFQLEYKVKHDIKLNPKWKQSDVLQTFGIKQKEVRGEEQDEAQAQTVPENLISRHQSRRRKRRQITPESDASEKEKRRRITLGWKDKNDDMFKIDKYVFNVDTRKREKKQGSSSESESSATSSSKDKDQMDMPTFITKVDDRIQQRQTDPTFEGRLSGQYIKQRARELYQMIYGEQIIKYSDDRYKKFLLDVFVRFPENPLANESVKCCMKAILEYCKNTILDDKNMHSLEKSNFDIKQSKEGRPSCDHTHADDGQLEKCYNMQLWFLNFNKYICSIVLEKQIKEIDIHDEERWKENRELVKEKEDQKERISASMEGHGLKQEKKSMKQMAGDYMLKNLVKYMEQMHLTKEENQVFQNKLKIESLLRDPVLKLIAVEQPEAVLKYQEQKAKIEPTHEQDDSGMIGYDNSKEIFFFSLASKVLKAFKKEIVKVQCKKYVTFKNVTHAKDELFDYYEQLDIMKHLQTAGITFSPGKKHIQGVENRYSQANLKKVPTLSKDQLRDSTDQTVAHQISSPKALSPNSSKEAATGYGKSSRKEESAAQLVDQAHINSKSGETLGEHNQELDEYGFGPGSQLPVTKVDMVRAAVAILSKKANIEIIKAGQKDVQRKLEKGIYKHFADFQKKVAMRSGMDVSEDTDVAKGVQPTKLNETMPAAMKRDMYRTMKVARLQKDDKQKRELHEEQEIKKQFFDESKVYSQVQQQFEYHEIKMGSNLRLSNHYKEATETGDSSVNENVNTIEEYCRHKKLAQDTNHDEMIEYFSATRSDFEPAVPFFFKNLKNNILYFRKLQINLSHAKAIKNVLSEAADKENYPQYLEGNPFLIKTLIIDECLMTDEVFAEILQGIEKQSFIRSIHYVNNNTLGPKSTEFLKLICGRQPLSEYLQELNLSNITVVKNRDQFSYLVQISQKIEDVMKLNRLKFSNMELNDRALTQNLLDILQSNFNLTYLNLSHSKLELYELLKITREFKKSCAQVQYLSIGGNPLTNEFQIPWEDEHINTGPKTVAPRRPPKGKMEDIRNQMVEELTQNICEFMELPATQLRFLDISEMEFKPKQMVQILKSIRKNTLLESINLGNVYSDEEFKLIREMLNLKRKTVKVDSDFTLQASLKEISLKDHYVNVGLFKHNRQQREQRESMLMLQDNIKYTNPMNSMLLNRTTRNPELFFNSMDANNMFDGNLDQQWKVVRNCFYCNGYRYTIVYFNAYHTSQNAFKVLEGQEDMMALLDSKYPSANPFLGAQAPLLIVDGSVYQMANPLVYACFLQLQALIGEIHASANKGGSDLTGMNVYGPSVAPLLKKQNEIVIEYLKKMDENELRRLLISLCNEIISTSDLEFMSEHQLNTLYNFYNTNWEYMIDKLLIEPNQEYVTIINDQPFVQCEKSMKQMEELKAAKKKSNKRDSVIINSAYTNGAGTANDNILNVTPVYMFAGYLPPGKNTIYVYDRTNRQILFKEIMIDLASKDGQMEGPTFGYIPPPLSAEQRAAIDEQYDESEKSPAMTGLWAALAKGV